MSTVTVSAITCVPTSAANIDRWWSTGIMPPSLSICFPKMVIVRMSISAP